MNIDTLIHARWIIPLEPEGTVYENYAIAIKDDKIKEILKSNDARKKYTAKEELDLKNHAIIPGLINSHTHAGMSLFRGLANDLPLMDWLNNYIWPAEKKWVSSEFVMDGTKLAIAEMLRSGTTCFNDMYFFPNITAEACVNTGMRAVIGLIVMNLSTAWANNSEQYLTKGEAVHDKYKHNPLIRTAFAPHAPYTVSNESLKKISFLAEELDIPIHMHVHETEDEINKSIKEFGKRPLERLAELDLLSSRLIAVHMTQLNDKEIDMLKKYEVNIVHCPESNLKLASGFCPVDKLLNHKINVSIGTDSTASNNDLDMIGEMRTTALLAKGVSRNHTSCNAYTTLKMATYNAAVALGLDKSIGSLKKGKQADIVAIDLGKLETMPVYDSISHIIYSGGREQVSDVWVAGKRLLKNKELTTLNMDELKNKVNLWEKEIKNSELKNI